MTDQALRALNATHGLRAATGAASVASGGAVDYESRSGLSPRAELKGRHDVSFNESLCIVRLDRCGLPGRGFGDVGIACGRPGVRGAQRIRV